MQRMGGGGIDVGSEAGSRCASTERCAAYAGSTRAEKGRIEAFRATAEWPSPKGVSVKSIRSSFFFGAPTQMAAFQRASGSPGRRAAAGLLPTAHRTCTLLSALRAPD
jgi:hypothetical protein